MKRGGNRIRMGQGGSLDQGIRKIWEVQGVGGDTTHNGRSVSHTHRYTHTHTKTHTHTYIYLHSRDIEIEQWI